MQSKNLENYIEFLLSAALQRCGNIYDAEDLTKETLLAALSYMARGKDIQDIKAWLLVVMGRKFNDMLRKRYKQPIVSIGDDFDIVDENAMIPLKDADDFYKGKNQKLPAHLESVPLQKQYMHAGSAFLFATIREAISRGKLYDGNDDDDSNGVNQPPCPMVLIIK